MKVLALDISTKSGWAFFKDARPISFGVIKLDRTIKDYGPKYPWNVVDGTEDMAIQLCNLVEEFQPDVVVIEQTNKARARGSQKILEFIHKGVLMRLRDWKGSVVYISSSVWRKNLAIQMSKEDKKNNSLVNKAKREGKSKKSLGLKGKITKKHLAVAHVNAHFGLNLKISNNDIADAICLAQAYCNNAPICDGE